jgi:hypothetical protein
VVVAIPAARTAAPMLVRPVVVAAIRRRRRTTTVARVAVTMVAQDRTAAQDRTPVRGVTARVLTEAGVAKPN